MKRLLVLSVLLLLACGVAARAQKKDEMPPLPARLLSAKTAVLVVDTDWVQGHTKHAYAQLKSWGRFQIVADQDAADIILSISDKQAGSAGLGSGSVVGNSVIGGGVSVPLHTYTLRVYDREKGTLLFVASTDERLAKSAEAKRLIGALRKRMEQEKP